LRGFSLVLFAVTANYLFSKYRLQALIFKISASAKLAVKYRTGRANTGHLATLPQILPVTHQVDIFSWNERVAVVVVSNETKQTKLTT